MAKPKGYCTDITCSWITVDHGPKWLQWQEYIAEWMAIQNFALDDKIKAVKHIIGYISSEADYAVDVANMFKGHPGGHKVSSKEFDAYLIRVGSNSGNSKYISCLISLCDHILSEHLSVEDDNGIPRPLFLNPFTKIKKASYSSETIYSSLPYRYIEKLRQILCPYTQGIGHQNTPWLGHHFKDWNWAIKNLGGNLGGRWMQISPDQIDQDDPDCVWRTRRVKSEEIFEIWSPVMSVFLFVKLHLPLRSYQVRFLDSGEGDTLRYENGAWVENTKHSFALGSSNRPYAKGIFKHIYDSYIESYTTGLYISTNKTADQNKDEIDRGYTIPWQHEELLYWLEKLRNWQEKYNPIDRLVPGTELLKKHTGALKSPVQLKGMGVFAFLFRDAASKGSDRYKPIRANSMDRPWFRLLEQLQKDLATSGHVMSNGEPVKLIPEFPNGYNRNLMVKTYFPLHSLRVSLITCYTMETELPLPVISKLLAGHTRILMTIYYNKITPSVMKEKMEEANRVLNARFDQQIKTFMKDAELNQIPVRIAFNEDKYGTVLSIISKRNLVGWETRSCGICLVGGNTVRSDEASSVGGCWNGGPLIKDNVISHSRTYGSVPPEACPLCRFFVTDASFLPELNARFNQLSYKAHQAAEIAVELEGELEALKDEEFVAAEQGGIFLKEAELQQTQRRYEKQLVEANDYAKEYIALFNLIKRCIDIENRREESDQGQKMIAVGTVEDVSVSIKFNETHSELFHLSLLCEDAEFYPDILDDLRKTSAIQKRSNAISRMMMRQGYRPVLLEMDDRTQLIVANAMMRKMAMLANHKDNTEGYRIAADYIEAQHYLTDSKLLDAGINELKSMTPLTLVSRNRIQLQEEEQ